MPSNFVAMHESIMRKLSKVLSDRLAPEASPEMRVRLFQLICLTIGLITILIVLPVNWFQNLPVLVNIGVVLLGLFAFFCFGESRHGRHHVSLFLVFMVLLMEPVWFLNSGTDGSITFYLLVVMVYPMVMFRGLKRWIWTAGLMLNICALLAIDYFFPSLTVPFRSRADRTLDLITGAFCSCLTLALTMWVVISNYDSEQERTEKYARDLAYQHDNLSGLIESIESEIFSVDRNFNYLSFNNAHALFMKALFNVEIEIGGNLLAYFTTSEYLDEAKRNIERALTGEKVLVLAQIKVRGKETTREIGHSPIRNNRMEVIGAVVYSRDVTERRAAEMALKESEERLRLFVVHAPAALAMFDRQMRYVSVSRRWLSDYGLEGRNILGKSHYEVFPEVPEHWREIHRRGLAGEVIRAQEDPLYQENGSTQWLCWEVRPWHDASGEVAGIVIFTEDITYRKQAEQALAEMHRRLAATVAAIPDLLFELDTRGRICEYHACERESLYAPPEAFLGKTVEQVLPPDASGIILDALKRAAAEGTHRGATYSLDMPGGRRWYEISIAVKPEGSAPDARFVALVRDITERKRAEEETMVLREELALFSRIATTGEMTASIAHELNQPLAAILNNAEAALRSMQGESSNLEELREILMDIAADDRRAAELIRSMRSMLKENGSEHRPLYLDELIADVLALVRNNAQTRKITISLDLDESIPPITGERVQLQQVFLNLIINAFEAMEGSEKPGKLVIRTRKSGKEILLDVIDSGPGIPPDRLDAIFKPFFTTKKNGLGIGLRLSRKIMNAHGGRLWAENNAEEGATFHLTLPMIGESGLTHERMHPEKEEQKQSDSSAQSNPTKRIRVLLADDDAAFQQRTADLLSKEPDMEIVGTANNGQEAAELAAKLSPDIILMDIDMPKLNGIEATLVIADKHPEICIIALSTHEENDRVQAMLNAGASKYLTKHRQTAELIRTIRVCTSHHLL